MSNRIPNINGLSSKTILETTDNFLLQDAGGESLGIPSTDLANSLNQLSTNTGMITWDSSEDFRDLRTRMEDLIVDTDTRLYVNLTDKTNIGSWTIPAFYDEDSYPTPGLLGAVTFVGRKTAIFAFDALINVENGVNFGSCFPSLSGVRINFRCENSPCNTSTAALIVEIQDIGTISTQQAFATTELTCGNITDYDTIATNNGGFFWFEFSDDVTEYYIYDTRFADPGIVGKTPLTYTTTGIEATPTDIATLIYNALSGAGLIDSTITQDGARVRFAKGSIGAATSVSLFGGAPIGDFTFNFADGTSVSTPAIEIGTSGVPATDSITFMMDKGVLAARSVMLLSTPQVTALINASNACIFAPTAFVEDGVANVSSQLILNTFGSAVAYNGFPALTIPLAWNKQSNADQVFIDNTSRGIGSTDLDQVVYELSDRSPVWDEADSFSDFYSFNSIASLDFPIEVKLKGQTFTVNSGAYSNMGFIKFVTEPDYNTATIVFADGVTFDRMPSFGDHISLNFGAMSAPLVTVADDHVFAIGDGCYWTPAAGVPTIQCAGGFEIICWCSTSYLGDGANEIVDTTGGIFTLHAKNNCTLFDNVLAGTGDAYFNTYAESVTGDQSAYTGGGGTLVITPSANASNIYYDNSVSGLTATEVKSAIDEVAAAVPLANQDIQITRGYYIYHAQGFSLDTAGDWRTYSDASGYYVQYCTVGNPVKGSGTWVTKSTVTI